MKKDFLDPIALARDFIRFDTTTPKDGGLQSQIVTHLEKLRFTVHKLPFDEVQNFYARLGTDSPVFCFAGHTDVVPSGPVENWRFPPFSGKITEEVLYGRGAADMKGALAAMISAAANFSNNFTHKKGSIAFLITGDEEGPSINGTAKVMEWLKQKGEKIDFCLVGEPTSNEIIGDTIKNGRRGSINGRLIIYGVQGHVAYPQLAQNPIHEGLEIIKRLIEFSFDHGNNSFDPTRLCLTNIHAGTGINNVTPDKLEARFNIRYGTASSFSSIKDKIEALLSQAGIKHTIELYQSGTPFLTQTGRLIESIIQSVQEEMGITPQLSTSGGTSDARFIAPYGIEVAELGLRHETIHKIDENISVEDLRKLTRIYEKILEKIFSI